MTATLVSLKPSSAKNRLAFSTSRTTTVTWSKFLSMARPPSVRLFEHDLFRKPVPTFRDHALARLQAVRLDRCKGLRAAEILDQHVRRRVALAAAAGHEHDGAL